MTVIVQLQDLQIVTFTIQIAIAAENEAAEQFSTGLGPIKAVLMLNISLIYCQGNEYTQPQSLAGMHIRKYAKLYIPNSSYICTGL